MPKIQEPLHACPRDTQTWLDQNYLVQSQSRNSRCVFESNAGRSVNRCNVWPSTGKNRRLKQAKEEAQAEIEQYRLQREKEFKTKEAAVCSLLESTSLFNKTYLRNSFFITVKCFYS